jgi:hypothetical protein
MACDEVRGSIKLRAIEDMYVCRSMCAVCCAGASGRNKRLIDGRGGTGGSPDGWFSTASHSAHSSNNATDCCGTGGSWQNSIVMHDELVTAAIPVDARVTGQLERVPPSFHLDDGTAQTRPVKNRQERLESFGISLELSAAPTPSFMPFSHAMPPFQRSPPCMCSSPIRASKQLTVVLPARGLRLGRAPKEIFLPPLSLSSSPAATLVPRFRELKLRPFCT